MTDPIVLEEGKIYKVKPPMMNVGALYQLSRYAYENDLKFLKVLSKVLDPVDCFYLENPELEKRIKDFIASGRG